MDPSDDGTLLVTTVDEVWRVTDAQDMQLLLDGQNNLIGAVESRPRLGQRLYVADQDRIVWYSIDDGIPTVANSVVDGDILGIASRRGIRDYGHSVLYAVREPTQIAVYESGRTVTTELARLADASSVEFIGVGDDLVVSTSTGETVLANFDHPFYENIGVYLPPHSGTLKLLPMRIPDATNGRSWTTVSDLDQNGLLDLIVSEVRYQEGGEAEATVTWYESFGSRFEPHVLGEGNQAFGAWQLRISTRIHNPMLSRSEQPVVGFSSSSRSANRF